VTNRSIRKVSLLWNMTLVAVVFLALGMSGAQAEPSKAQVTKMWEDQHNVKGRVLELKNMGGERTTNELHGKKYITPVATCWDYNIVELQKCGCRLFEKSSACCRKGSSTDCELRIGNSKLIDCAKYGKPKFGLSGDQEPEDCKASRQASDCWKRKDLVFGQGAVIGPCQQGPEFVCPKGWETAQDFHNRKCGPTPEDCGCTLVEECSKPELLKCYKDWKSNKAAVDCYWNPMYKSPYDRDKCYKTVTGEGVKEAVKDGAAGSVPAVPSPPSPGTVSPGTVMDGLKKFMK
jgi:hypothetical protein